MAVAPGQRRCTNCGASVDTHKRLPRRTPLVAALAVAVVSGGVVVVAQAAVTEKSSIDASAPADVASAPVTVVGTSLPPAKKPTSTAPATSTPDVNVPAGSTPDITIPSSPTDLLKAAERARKAAEKAAKDAAKKAKETGDGENLPEDTTPTSPDLQDPKHIKVVHTENYSPEQRAGAEFGKPKAAVDKRNRTVWDVNIPADGQPFNVGIVLDLGEVKHVSSLKIRTPTPGFGAVIYRSDADEIPEKIDDRWTRAAKIDSVSDDLTVPITKGDPEWARYILVYLTTPIAADNTRAAISDLEVLP